MKQFIVALIYISLATLVIGYLFLVLNIPNLNEIVLGAFWLHIAAYIGYSFLVPSKDNRMIYPMSILLLAVSVYVFNLPLNEWFTSMTLSILTFILFMIYSGFHLLQKGYLGDNDIKYLPHISIVSLGIIVIATVFKIMHWPMVTQLMIVGCSLLALLLILTGMTKGLKRKIK